MSNQPPMLTYQEGENHYCIRCNTKLVSETEVCPHCALGHRDDASGHDIQELAAQIRIDADCLDAVGAQIEANRVRLAAELLGEIPMDAPGGVSAAMAKVLARRPVESR